MKRIDLRIGKSRSERNLMSLRTVDGKIPHVQELLTEAGFEDGERVAIISVIDLDALIAAAENEYGWR